MAIAHNTTAPPAAARPRARRKLTRPAAFTGSVLFHLALFVVGFARASGGLVSAADAGGGPTGPVFEVSLVRLQPTVTVGAENPEASQSKPLLLRRRDALEGIPVPAEDSRNALQALTERFRVATAANLPGRLQAHAPSELQGSRNPSNQARPTNALSEARTDEGTSGPTANAASTASLWGQIEPCWHNLGVRTRVPVVVEVELDRHGQLSIPPKVIRDQAVLLDEPRLRSEASALDALRRCMPRGDVRFASQRLRLEFLADP